MVVKAFRVVGPLVLMMLGHVGSSLAQSAAPAPTTEPEGSPESRFESTVVVTATRTEVASGEVPVSTSVVTRDELLARNVQTLDQGLNLLSGVHVLRTRGVADAAARVTMRGFNGANRTLVLLDGQPLNDAYTGELAWTSLPGADIDRVEAVRGSFSALYGGSAMGGVISLLSRPIDRRQVELSAQVGTHGTTDYAARYATRLWSRLGVAASVQRLETDGYRSRLFVVTPGAGAVGTVVTGARAMSTPTGAPGFVVGEGGENWSGQTAARTRIEATPNGRDFLAGHYVFQSSAYGFEPSTSLLRDASGAMVDRGPVIVEDGGVRRQLSVTPGTLLQGPGDSRSHLVGVSYRRAFDRVLLQIVSGMNDQPAIGTQTPTVATATAAGGPGVLALRDSRTYTASVQATYARTAALELTGGVDLRRDRSDNSEFAQPDWLNRDQHGSQTFQSYGRTLGVGTYGQVRLPLGDRVGITAGARLDDWRTSDGFTNIFDAALPPTEYDDRGNRSLSGKVSMVARPSAGWTLRGSAGTAFRNPTVFELYRSFRLSTGTLYLANPDLKPETNTGMEIGLARELTAGGSIEATAYLNRTRELIYRKTDLSADPTGRTRVLMNAGEGTTRGFEIAARYDIGRLVDLRAQYTRTHAVITKNPIVLETEGKRVPFVPDHMASVAVLVGTPRFSGALSGRYVSSLYSLDTNVDATRGVMGSYSPSFVADASAAWHPGRGVEVFGSIENLLDRQYFVFYMAPGRTINVGMRLRLSPGK